MDVQVDIDELKLLDGFIKRFGPAVTGGEELRKALAEGGKYIRNLSRQSLIEKMSNPGGVSGNLLKSYKITVKKGNTGVLIGFNKYGHHAHLVDLGHRIVSHGKGTNYRSKSLLFHTEAKMHLGQAARIVINSFDIDKAINAIR